MSQVTRIALYSVCFGAVFLALPVLPGTYASPAPWLGTLFAILFTAWYRSLPAPRAVFGLFAFVTLSILPLVSLAMDTGFALRHAMIGILGLGLAVISYVGFLQIFARTDQNRIIAAFVTCARFLAVVAAVEISLKMVGLGGVFDAFSEVVSHRASTRVILTAPEPSWAGILLVWHAPFLAFEWLKNRRRFDLCALVVYAFAGLLTFSITTIAVFALAVFFLLILSGRVSLKSLALGAVAVALTAVVFVKTVTYLTVDGSDAYYYTRLLKIRELASSGELWSGLLAIDWSILVRLGYQKVGLNMLLENPVGIGLGQFGARFPDFVAMLPVGALQVPEVAAHVEKLNADPRNFLIKVALENGLLAFSVLLLWIRGIVANVNRIADPSVRWLTQAILAVNFAVMFQMSTVYFAQYWIGFAIATHFGNAAQRVLANARCRMQVVTCGVESRIHYG